MATKILFLGCVHGDEQVGKYIVENYETGKNCNFQWKAMIGNPKAMYANKRYNDTDLNRAFPGKIDGNYEEKLAYEISKILPQYDLVIDFHQSNTEIEDTIFVKTLTPYLKEICQYFEIQHIVELDKGKGDYNGLLIEQVENAIALEYGRLHDYEDACRRVQRDILNLLSKQRTQIQQKTYRIFGKPVGLEFRDKLNLKDFQLLTREELEVLGIFEEDIYSVFVNGYEDEGIYCKLVQTL